MLTMFLLMVVIGIVSYGFHQCYRSRIRLMRLLRNHNIPGPRPNIFYGQMVEVNSTPNVIWDSKMIDE